MTLHTQTLENFSEPNIFTTLNMNLNLIKLTEARKRDYVFMLWVTKHHCLYL